MNNKKDILPIIIASVIALLITIVVRLLLPGGTFIQRKEQQQSEISMPKIPLIMKSEVKKEVQVLFVSTKITKGSKVKENQLSWKKWPEDALQPYFIAKTEKGTALNNGADYTNALKMWAISDIPAGVPLTMQMLTNEDPVKKAEAALKAKKEKEAKEAALKAAQQKKIEEEKAKAKHIIGKGMRAVTFGVNQQSAVSTSMMSVGDYVDILIMQSHNGKNVSHKYSALKILAIDGVTDVKNTKKSMIETLGSINNIFSPRNITLEVRSDLVDGMLEQAGSNGVIVSLRNQEDEKEEQQYQVKQEEEEKEKEKQTDDTLKEEEKEVLLKNVVNMNRSDAAELMKNIKHRQDAERKNLEELLHSITSISRNDQFMPALKQQEEAAEEESKDENAEESTKEKSEDTEENKKARSGGRMEMVSGKIVGEEQMPDPIKINIYKAGQPVETIKIEQ